jgi:hypothetical protein
MMYDTPTGYAHQQKEKIPPNNNNNNNNKKKEKRTKKKKTKKRFFFKFASWLPHFRAHFPHLPTPTTLSNGFFHQQA